MSKKRIILSSKAAGGKDYFRDYLNQHEPLDISYTTRPKRIGEKEGYTYNYISQEKFLNMHENNYFLEAVNFNNWWYGTSMDNWMTKNIFIMTPSGVKCIPEEDRKDCIIVYFDIPVEIRKERLSERSDADSVDRRILADEKDFEGFSNFDIRVTNPTYNASALYYLILRYGEI
ncbi:MAG: guanylate kinase [Flavobacteriaceae bacterium]|jgi:guanylate kinase